MAKAQQKDPRMPMADEGVWTLIESDPGVFTEMLRGFGVEGVQVEELHSLSEEETANYNPIYGLIFLFKWRPGEDPIGEPVDTSNVFFAQQVITNACATQAIINLLMNVSDTKVKLGPVLEEYRDFAKHIDPASRGLVLSNCEKIRQVHNSFARPTFYELDLNLPPSEDNYHFITFVPVGNKIYELDGLREFPLEVSTIPEGKSWMEVISPILTERMRRFNDGDIMFNLMAVVGNMMEKYTKRREEILEGKITFPSTDAMYDELAIVENKIDEEGHKLDISEFRCSICTLHHM
ncbi:ubiquitin carboxyl-terminal hydrolase, family 1 [Necator americanus]|uniref:Ubiquitin carboxyl-terminal hydrolase n=1 Tax=Necator americanus TaxID=51031 RepID=W2T135_NECAM|nr:ubiquitin carboxyl-terminal hydrolase, family 1 [Necator americanus]ETN75613.1 ubiquitin carboxyl-terminal hydrolase, family 1 [Necator americanus]